MVREEDVPRRGGVVEFLFARDGEVDEVAYLCLRCPFCAGAGGVGMCCEIDVDFLLVWSVVSEGVGSSFVVLSPVIGDCDWVGV